jgi:3D-(3,5/4)-trihydroxycyclohexane-1,2-dione acylhydrolase (decyclizing)
LPGDVFASRRPDPVLQQIQGFGDPTVWVNDCFRPVSRWWDRITRPEQILESLPQALRVLTDPPMGADVPRPRSEEVRFAHDSALEGAGFEPSVPRERVCAFRDHVLSLQSVRRPLRSKWYIDDSDGPPLFGFDIHGQYLLVDVERASVSRTASGSG